ncbi:unnamed protein product [Ectocarpus sp. 8 AP-2014]
MGLVPSSSLSGVNETAVDVVPQQDRDNNKVVSQYVNTCGGVLSPDMGRRNLVYPSKRLPGDRAGDDGTVRLEFPGDFASTGGGGTELFRTVGFVRVGVLINAW